MPHYYFSKPYADFVARLRVPTGFILVLAFAWASKPDLRSLAYGLPLSILGLLLRGWAAGHLAKNQTLTRGGPYAYLRNPLYVGTLAVAAGLVIASRQWALAILFAAVFLLVYLPVIELEEQHLRKLFPDYEQYAKEVPALFPRLEPATGNTSFHWVLYRKNQEYQALLGFLAGVALLIYKAF